MRVALNLLYVTPGLAGGRVYAEGLLRGLAATDEDNEYLIYTRHGVAIPPLPASRFRQEVTPVPATGDVRRTLWEYGRLPGVARHQGCRLLHGLGSLSPPARGGAFVLTIHDVIYRQFPQSLPLGPRLFMRLVHPYVARRADRVIVPSRHSASEVINLLGVQEERVRVVPYGAGNELHPVTDPAVNEAVLVRHNVRRPYLVSVCRAYAHKNLAGLLRAFARLRASRRDDVQLVLVGDRYRTGDALDRLTNELNLSPAVVFTGFVTNEDLSSLYSSAEAFVFPSLAEGFGLPILEAMSCGVPIVASNASAVPEAVGDAGVTVDTQDAEAFAAALRRVLDDSALRSELSRRGLARAARFTWEESARQTLAVYQDVI